MTEDRLEEIDRWALTRLDELSAGVCEAYESFTFHEAFHRIHHFCVVDLSNFYLDVLKDRLYVEKADSVTRRAAQTVIYRILHALTRLVAPILAYTSEEIWSYLPHGEHDDARSVLFNDMPKGGAVRDKAFMERWERIHALRNDVQKALEAARAQKLIGGSLDAQVTLHCKGELLTFVQEIRELLPSVLIVSKVDVTGEGEGDAAGETEGLRVSVAHAQGGKCSRCWTYSETVGQQPGHAELCARCAAIIE